MLSSMINNALLELTYWFYLLQVSIIIVECHKWFMQDKIMTDSEERAHEKFTMGYFVKDFNNEVIQKDLIWCLNFASEAHKEQKRKDIESTPYINHPIGVAYILSEEAGVTSLDLLRGCLLHDTVEDTSVVIDVIRAKFGDYIANLVEEVTDDKSLPKQKRKDLQVIHARTSSPQAKMVKLADKLYNLRDLDRSLPKGWTEERRREYYDWAFQVCEGLRGINPKLEEKLDRFFKTKGFISGREPIEEPLESYPWPNHEELKLLLAAANFAAEKHRRHFLFDAPNSVPYINHVISVAFIVSEEAGIYDIPVLCAALLSDVVVGKGNSAAEDIAATFGQEVGHLVAELTLNHSSSIEDQFKDQMNKAGGMSYHAKVITLAAMIDKCRRLEVFEPQGWSGQLRENYFRWAFQLCTTLANTHPHLELELNNIWVGQGLKKFPMQSKEENQCI
uniref:Guanosine-3',5'-bis(diphosphate) 3'-pyrophosphohydrolase MESH1 n=2 Tax=Graphocephala atropunctata TaxID=36148 RepID=A0A1B6LLC0_9HEMI